MGINPRNANQVAIAPPYERENLDDMSRNETEDLPMISIKASGHIKSAKGKAIDALTSTEPIKFHDDDDEPAVGAEYKS